jgi:hypothetical protein
MSLRSLLVIFVVLCACAHAPAQAQSVYLLLVGDTDNPNYPQLTEGVKSNISRMQDFGQKIKNLGGINVVEKDVIDGAFSCTAISNLVNELNPGADDVVVFYYSGHGVASHTKYPAFDCGADNRPDLAGTVDILSHKNPRPRLIVAIADACNQPSSGPLNLGPFSEIERAPSQPDLAPAYQHLFLDYAGTIFLAAAVPGEPAYYINPGAFVTSGGIFTNKFLDLFATDIVRDLGKVRWETIAHDASASILVPPVGGGPKLTQTPLVDASSLVAKRPSRP